MSKMFAATFSALTMTAALATGSSALAQTPPRQAAADAAKAPEGAAPATEATKDPGNPGYPMQGGGTYQGPPGKGAVINKDRGYNRT